MLEGVGGKCNTLPMFFGEDGQRIPANVAKVY